MKKWNWQKPEWPNFTWDKSALSQSENDFLHHSGIFVGSAKHIDTEEQTSLVVELITGEAIKTSEIEGELLNRDSVQSSIRRNLGLATDNRKVQPAERGIADMMVELYRGFDRVLTQETLFGWHKLISNGRTDLRDIGRYRTDSEPMQVVSGPIYDPVVHFEAPPSKQMKREMNGFMKWYAKSGSRGNDRLPALTRAGIAHLYFISVHPFEDGNGRIARALSEKVISESLGYPTLIALSHIIQKKRKEYYDALARSNRDCEITSWLLYFSQTVLEAQSYTQKMITFSIEKTKLYDRVGRYLNDRQHKVLLRMFREGVEGFKGGMNAEKYIKLTGASRATTTRDLHDLVSLDVFVKHGELKSTRYEINLPVFQDRSS